MPLPKPQKPASHSNSKIARSDLKKYLPEDWNLAKNVDDDDSGIEWGEDWIVEIVEDHQATGAKFGIQSKVLRRKDAINSKGIGTSIEITTINRLFDLPYPVLFHYVHPKTRSSYVMWLDDWMSHQKDLSWRTNQKGAITVRIPAIPQNRLGSDTVEQIRQKALAYSLNLGNYKIVDLINRSSKDHRVDLLQTEKGIKIAIHALHDHAIPQVTPLDEEAIQAFEKMSDTGLPTPITGKVGFSNIPPLLTQYMQEFNLTTAVARNNITLNKTMVFSVDFSDAERRILYRTAQISMKVVQQGRKIIKWEGSSQVDGITLWITRSREKPKQFELGFELTSDDEIPLLVVSNRLRFIRAIQNARYSTL